MKLAPVLMEAFALSRLSTAAHRVLKSQEAITQVLSLCHRCFMQLEHFLVPSSYDLLCQIQCLNLKDKLIEQPSDHSQEG